MKKSVFSFFALCLSFITTTTLIADIKDERYMMTLPVETAIDKIRGGLLGQILGNLNGLKHEMRYVDEPGNVKNYIPRLPDGAWTDDDTDFEWVYIVEMQKYRNAFLSNEQITQLWQERINDRIWCSNRFARYLMDIGIKPPYTGYSVFNPWAEFNISGQFLSETFGLIAPGMPQTAAKIGLNYTRVAINNEPAQTTQLFTTMIATAFMESDINKILDAGVQSLDETSTILRIIYDIRKWHNKYPEDWRETRKRLRDKYTQEGGKIRDSNGYELNTGAIVASLLYGKGDFAESLKFAFNFGWDADCNAATLGTIIGVMTGYRDMQNQNDPYNPDWQIVDRYRNTTRSNMPMNETITSFADRIIELFEMINQQNGGSKTLENNMMVYKIIIEQPSPVTKISSISEQTSILKENLEKKILDDLLDSNREGRARAVYMAICLDINDSIKQNYPEQWKVASHDLHGYWKIMDNIFFGDFRGIHLFKQKFEKAGFKMPSQQSSAEELYSSPAWRDPN